jgi:hypothetical protein
VGVDVRMCVCGIIPSMLQSSPPWLSLLPAMISLAIGLFWWTGAVVASSRCSRTFASVAGGFSKREKVPATATDGMGLVGSTSKMEAQVEFVAGVGNKFWTSNFCNWTCKWDLEVSIWRPLPEMLYRPQKKKRVEFARAANAAANDRRRRFPGSAPGAGTSVSASFHNASSAANSAAAPLGMGSFLERRQQPLDPGRPASAEKRRRNIKSCVCGVSRSMKKDPDQTRRIR